MIGSTTSTTRDAFIIGRHTVPSVAHSRDRTIHPFIESHHARAKSAPCDIFVASRRRRPRDGLHPSIRSVDPVYGMYFFVCMECVCRRLPRFVGVLLPILCGHRVHAARARLYPLIHSFGLIRARVTRETVTSTSTRVGERA